MLNKLFKIIGRMSGKANLTFLIYGFPTLILELLVQKYMLLSRSSLVGIGFFKVILF